MVSTALTRSDSSPTGPLDHAPVLVVIVPSWLVLEEAITPLRDVGGVLLLCGATMLRQEGSAWALVRPARRIWADAGARAMLGGRPALGRPHRGQSPRFRWPRSGRPPPARSSRPCSP